jgi:DNA-binding NarL/FixJ family response regulator
MIRIVLADDHPVVREGLRAMLSAEPDLDVVADASSGPQAEALAAELRPDIVLMDLRMPGGGGVDSIVRMSAAGLPCRVIVLTTYETDRDILRAVEAGAAGYLLKDLPRGELADAVRAAARGETVLAPSVAARLVDQLRTRPERPRLSERETAVLRLVAEGCTNAEIGRRLYIGESTVKTHLLRVFGKLGVNGGGDECDAVWVAGLFSRPRRPYPSHPWGLRPQTPHRP